MTKDLLELIRCPITNKSLSLYKIEHSSDSKGNEYCKTGILWSDKGYWYPVINYVPVMLTFPTELTRSFERKNKESLSNISQSVKLPDQTPEKGEESVQKTFTEEWGGLKDDELTFVYNDEELLLLHRDIWLQMTEEERRSKKSVLDVGCGYGKEAIVLTKIFPEAFVVGADMNLAVIEAGERLVREKNVNPVVASLFHLPFADNGFDHVHCQGVIHHTFSTYEGFKAISRKVDLLKGTLFVWVYAKEDRYMVPGIRGFCVWLYWTVSHSIFRPILSRSPSLIRSFFVHLISILMHPVIMFRGRNKGKWKYANTVHGIRDAFTPMYAHEHGFNEFLGWFEETGFNPVLQRSAHYKEIFGSRLVGAGANGYRKDETIIPSGSLN
tara:strand:+ start:1080 stop:2228 length:1149 start_codon:yes stop_codon:yes gene_type:complete